MAKQKLNMTTPDLLMRTDIPLPLLTSAIMIVWLAVRVPQYLLLPLHTSATADTSAQSMGIYLCQATSADSALFATHEVALVDVWLLLITDIDALLFSSTRRAISGCVRLLETPI